MHNATTVIEMQSIEECAEEDSTSTPSAQRSRNTGAPLRKPGAGVGHGPGVTSSGVHRDPPTQILTTINVAPSAVVNSAGGIGCGVNIGGSGNGGNSGWLGGWTNTVSVINKPVQCRAVVCRQRKMSGALSTAAAIGLSSSVYYERMHRRRASAISQLSSASVGRPTHASGNELQKIPSESSVASAQLLTAESQPPQQENSASATNLNVAQQSSVSFDSYGSLTRRKSNLASRWLASPNNASAQGNDAPESVATGEQTGTATPYTIGQTPGASTDEPESQPLLTRVQTCDSSSVGLVADREVLATDRKSFTPQQTFNASREEKEEEVDCVAVTINANCDDRSRSSADELQKRDQRRVRTILRQQSAEVSGYKFAYKLSRREALLNKRRLLASCSLWLALFGIVLIVTENELMVRELEAVWLAKADFTNCRGGGNTQINLTEQYIEAILAYKLSWPSQLLKMLTSISTVCLLVAVVADRIVLLELFKINNSIGDWHLVLSPKWAYRVCIELLICAIHPLPVYTGSVILRWSSIPTPKNHDSFRFTPLDVFLSLPMLARLYLIFRVIVAYSRHTVKASSHSISALNRINVDAKFILKTTAIAYPGTLLLGFIAVFWITASWCMRLCEGFHDVEFLDFWNSAWLTAVTFFSIGYGDIVPTTGCGRSVAILTGLTGAGCIAFVVAVLARKIELSKAELYMHNFLRDMRITNSLKNTAANVLRETWLIHKYSKPDKERMPRVRYHERKFFRAIQKLRRIKVQQRELMDSATAMIDITPLHTQLTEVIDSVQEDQMQIYDKLGALESKFSRVCSLIDTLSQPASTHRASSTGGLGPTAPSNTANHKKAED